MTRTTSERDESAWSAATTPQMSRRDLLRERAELHPDDLLPPAAHLMPAPGVDPLSAFAKQVRALRFVGALTRCAHPHCRTSLTEETVTYCPHDLPFCEACVWEDGCEVCDVAYQDACDVAHEDREARSER